MINIETTLQGMINRYSKKVLPNQKITRGILNSEGFIFCALCDYLKVDMILESGVGNAGSMTIWGKYFSNQVISIVGIDLDISSTAAIRTCIYTRIILMEGDAKKIIPEIIQNFPEKTIGIFIDGPKSERAIKLAKTCYEYKNVSVIGIHDMFEKLYGDDKLCHGRKLFNNWEVQKFCTDVDWFIRKYSFLDMQNGQAYSQPEKYSKYGPTVGVVWK